MTSLPTIIVYFLIAAMIAVAGFVFFLFGRAYWIVAPFDQDFRRHPPKNRAKEALEVLFAFAKKYWWQICAAVVVLIILFLPR